MRPAEANLIYTTQPIFSAIFAAALLHEHLSTQGLVGGAIIGGALLISLSGGEGEANSSVPAQLGGNDEEPTSKPKNTVSQDAEVEAAVCESR